MIWTVLATIALSGAPDPRIQISELQLENRPELVLEVVERSLLESPESAQEMGFDYLRAHLLELDNRYRQAHRAFTTAMSHQSTLVPYSRFRLAVNQQRRGHPEVAAGLLATLLASKPPDPLVVPAMRALVEALEEGADCRLLQRVEEWSLPSAVQRRLLIAHSDCTIEQRGADASVSRLVELLRQDTSDEPARLAAERLDQLSAGLSGNRETFLLIGQTFHHHRQFGLSLAYLGRGLRLIGRDESDGPSEQEARYALARAHFWRGEYLRAATEFGKIAAETPEPTEKARVLYQQGRCFELKGSWEAAVNGYRLAYLEDPTGPWGDLSLFSAIRIDWRRGKEDEALALFEILSARREWRGLLGHAAVFLASSDLVRGRGDRAEAWLALARRSDRQLEKLVNFWSGRAAELNGDADRAVAAYLRVLADQPFHPLSERARIRLRGADLAASAKALRRRLETKGTVDSRYRAWLLRDGDDLDSTAGATLNELLRSDRAASRFLDISFRPPREWPLWEKTLRQPEEILLALSIWEEGSAAVPRHFPVDDPSLGYTGSRLLARAGAHRAALRIAEIVHKQALQALPTPFAPTLLRRAAYPLPYGSLIAEEAARHNVDPYLLTALIREESRFDPGAVSTASARGLTQFVLSTAERMAPKANLPDLTVPDLHRPEVSIALGAAYLADLFERFRGREFEVIAAYNAGENQAELWQSYCFSLEPEEYFSKVGFQETRRYLERVLSSGAIYRDLYPPEVFATSAGYY
jgi:soluble lytic murein transglycosylase